ncbi:MAG: lysophospholipase L1-like esterase [Halieaceae bacterium]
MSELSDWLIPRTGMGSMAIPIASAPQRIAYLGASVTAQKDGYRPALHEALIQRYGQEHRAINAAIGGIGSTAAVFLMDGLVLRHKPAVCLIELSTGDCENESDTRRLGPVLEGIVRKLRSIACKIIFVHGYRNETEVEARQDMIVAAHENIAEKYGIPSLLLHQKMGQSFANGELEEGICFKDLVHTTPHGAKVMASLILEGLHHLLEINAPDTVINARYRDNYERTEIVKVDPLSMVSRPDQCNRESFRFVYPYVTLGVENELQFSSEGDIVGMVVVVGPDSGMVRITTAVGNSTRSLFDMWCAYERVQIFCFGEAGRYTRDIKICLTDDAVNYNICLHTIPDTEAIIKKLRVIGWMVRW